MKDKLYCFIFKLGLKRYSKKDLNLIMLDNIKKINSCNANSRYRHILVLQNKCISKRLIKLSKKG